MDLEDNAMGLTFEQTDKILQFQDLTGIEDMSVCRDVLQRHQWDLEVILVSSNFRLYSNLSLRSLNFVAIVLVLCHRYIFYALCIASLILFCTIGSNTRTVEHSRRAAVSVCDGSPPAARCS